MLFAITLWKLTKSGTSEPIHILWRESNPLKFYMSSNLKRKTCVFFFEITAQISTLIYSFLAVAWKQADYEMKGVSNPHREMEQQRFKKFGYVSVPSCNPCK